MAKVKDGWHKFYDYKVLVENGMVVCGIDGEGVNQKTVYPYRPCKTGGWYCDQTMTLDAFRAAWLRDTANLF